jgi:hypothetical protein
MYAFEQDVPIGRSVYADIVARLGDEVPQGLLLHVALEREDGTLRYLDVWEDQATCDRFAEERLHPAVRPALEAADIHPDGEPSRAELGVVHMWGAMLAQPVTNMAVPS